MSELIFERVTWKLEKQKQGEKRTVFSEFYPNSIPKNLPGALPDTPSKAGTQSGTAIR